MNQPQRREEHPPPRRDLSALVGSDTPPRLPPRPKRGETSTKSTPAPAPAPEPAPTPTKAQEPARSNQGRTGRRHPPGTSTRAIYVDQDVALEMAARRRKDQVSNTGIVLAAIKHTHDVLGRLVADDLAQDAPQADLWDEPAGTPRPRGGGRRPAVQFYPTDRQVDAIDQLVQTTGARDRSHLIGLALRSYLALDDKDS